MDMSRYEISRRIIATAVCAAPEVDFVGGCFCCFFLAIKAISSAVCDASLTRTLCFVYSLLITELNGMYLLLVGVFGVSSCGEDRFSSLLYRCN